MLSLEAPLVMSPIVRAWQCQQRGQCCKGHHVPVDLVTFRRMRRALDAEGDPRAPLMDEERAEHLDGWLGLPRVAEEACVFLEGRLCGWRLRHGTASLPKICGSYPHMGLLTPRRLLFGLMFSCPTALGLLAREDGHPLLHEPDGALPTHEIAVALDRDDCRLLDGTRTDADAFFEALWTWGQRFRASSGRPAERLLALTGVDPSELPLPGLDPAALRAYQPPPEWVSLALEEGAFELLLGLWSTEPARDYAADPPPPDLDEPAFVGRYLAHRLLLPVGLGTTWSLSRLLTMLFAMLVRYRLERARGFEPLRAVQRLDILAVHMGLFAGLCPRPDDDRWQLLAAMALALEPA